MSAPTASASPAASHNEQEWSWPKILLLGPYWFEWMVISLPFRLVWALVSFLLGALWAAIRHPIKTVQSISLGSLWSAIKKIALAWAVLYGLVMLVSTIREDKNILGRVDTPFIYAGKGLWYLLADGWQTAGVFVGMLANDLGILTFGYLHGFPLLVFAIVVPHVTILAAIFAVCETFAWWCDYGTCSGAIGTIAGTIGALALLAKFAPNMSIGSGSSGHSKPAGGGHGHGS